MRTILCIVAGSLLALGTFSGANAAVEIVAEETTGDSFLDHPGGALQRSECRGTTPEFLCTTGAHTRGGFTVSHGFTAMVGPTYTGTVESTLSWISQGGAQGARNFACTFSGGILVSCLGSGAFMPVGAPFVQTCKSYNSGTTTPGGSGAWGCFVSHN